MYFSVEPQTLAALCVGLQKGCTVLKIEGITQRSSNTFALLIEQMFDGFLIQFQALPRTEPVIGLHRPIDHRRRCLRVLDAMLQQGLFEDMRATLLNGEGMALLQLRKAGALQRASCLLQGIDFDHGQAGQIPAVVFALCVFVGLRPFLVIQGLLIGVTQALEALGVFVRTGLFEQGSVLAFDTARIGVGRKAKDGPATHCVYNSIENLRRGPVMAL
ncbi:hypothetical protein PS624_04776 [Pseudomonas fluorescens]|uniref:Uncharacterized protein n=1 Tax=Pseudomonas fluorescens TaxID=294 RepID=A0A5E6WPE7_PSEFL|nr:hypothetical protein PS624_04776 [Pseudomonas fluorescens]